MTRRAIDGIRELRENTAGPEVTATVTVDQVYAQVQHEALEFKHPRGGQAKYLTTPLLADSPEYIQSFANRVLDTENAAQLWGRTAGTGLQDSVGSYAPIMFNDLRRSAALKVTEGAGVVMDIPAEQPRLTEAELDYKSALRDAMGLGPTGGVRD